jgi:hypothetical protein
MLLQLAQLRGGLQSIGVTNNDTWNVITSTALNSIPSLRRRILDYLVEVPDLLPTARTIGDAIGYFGGAVQRALEDLSAHGLAERHSSDIGEDRWIASKLTRDCCTQLSGGRVAPREPNADWWRRLK